MLPQSLSRRRHPRLAVASRFLVPRRHFGALLSSPICSPTCGVNVVVSLLANLRRNHRRQQLAGFPSDVTTLKISTPKSLPATHGNRALKNLHKVIQKLTVAAVSIFLLFLSTICSSFCQLLEKVLWQQLEEQKTRHQKVLRAKDFLLESFDIDDS